MTSITEQLSKPFPIDVHTFRVMRTGSQGGAQIAAYISARDVMDRLDEVVDWSDSYTVIDIRTGKDFKGNDELQVAVQCQLVVGDAIHQDVGTGNGPDAFKGAYSDALKRAAVHVGIGRYLYGWRTNKWYAIDQYKNLTPQAKSEAYQDLAAYLNQSVHAPTPAYAEEDFSRETRHVKDVLTTPQAAMDQNDGDLWGDGGGWSEATAEFINWCLTQSSNDTRSPSTAQVAYAAKLIDTITGKPGSTADILATLHATPGYSNVVVKELLDTLSERKQDRNTKEWGDNPLYSPDRVQAIKEIWEEIK